MKTKLGISKSVLLLCISLLLNLSYNKMKAQTNIAELRQKEVDDTMYSEKRYLIKNKIKAITRYYYDSDDSIVNNAKLSLKRKFIYDREGNLVEEIRENSKGEIVFKEVSKSDSVNKFSERMSMYIDSENKVIASSEKKYFYYDNLNRKIGFKICDSSNNVVASGETTYDDSNRIIGWIYYQPENKFSSSGKTIYDNSNRIIEDSWSEVIDYYAGVVLANDTTILTHIFRYKYDLNDYCIEEYIILLSGVVINKTVSKFDNKSRLVFSEYYDHNLLRSKETNVYDKKGGYIQTREYNENHDTHCIIIEYDNKGNKISDIDTFNKNGSIITTKITNDYKYSNNDKLLSLTTTTETKSQMVSSIITTTNSYKYDTNGNEIELLTMSESGSVTTTKKEYNSNNKITKKSVFGEPCASGSSDITFYVYYPDGKTLKESIVEWKSPPSYPSKSITKYNERSHVIEEIGIGPSSIDRTVYNYEYW